MATSNSQCINELILSYPATYGNKEVQKVIWAETGIYISLSVIELTRTKQEVPNG